MIVIDLGSTRPAVDRCLAAIAVGLMLLGPAAAAAQTLPRVEGPLTMEEAVDLARQKNLRVKVADADARTMDSMRKEALAPFWPQLSANGYSTTSASSDAAPPGATMGAISGVTRPTRDATSRQYSLSRGGGITATRPARRAEARREMRRGRGGRAMQASWNTSLAAGGRYVRVTGERGDVDERLRVTARFRR